MGSTTSRERLEFQTARNGAGSAAAIDLGAGAELATAIRTPAIRSAI
jgi:hypothetical protein